MSDTPNTNGDATDTDNGTNGDATDTDAVEAIRSALHADRQADRDAVLGDVTTLADDGDGAIDDATTAGGSALPILLDAYDTSTEPVDVLGRSTTVELLVAGTCARCGYDRLVEAGTLESTSPPHYVCHACGALQFRDEPTTDEIPNLAGQRIGPDESPADVFDGSHAYRWSPHMTGRHTRTRDRADERTLESDQ